MNSPTSNASIPNSISGTAPQAVADSPEATLRLIARLPAPQGLEDRVIVGLKTTPHSARILHWPDLFQPSGSWMRGAAAAAIVFVVAGGGWGICTRVQPTQPAKVIVMPPRVGAAGSFSNAGAMRTPQTLNGPVLTQSVLAQPVLAQPIEIKPSAKTPVRAVTMPLRRPRPIVLYKSQAQSVISAAK